MRASQANMAPLMLAEVAAEGVPVGEAAAAVGMST